MRLIYIACVVFLLFLFAIPTCIYAITDPLAVPNNKYGIHIIDENDLENAAALVNSSGGDWGYVTIVIRQDDRNLDKWRSIFAKLQNLHLIPLLRLATQTDGDKWIRPHIDQAISWKEFLNQLPWPIKNRYVILFNEPNHSKEWGGSVDPLDYALILKSYSTQLKESSSDYFILPAGLDTAAPNDNQTMDFQTFMNALIYALPDFSDLIDGWTSHSYPNPGFIGKVTSYGKGTIRSYQWELNQLRKKGIIKPLPVFITETGWPHQNGTSYGKYFYDEDKVAANIRDAASSVWNDLQIVAITPFVLNYQSYPFDQFSWQKMGSQEFYGAFYAYQSIVKIAGQPEKPPLENMLQNSILGLQEVKDAQTQPREIQSQNFILKPIENQFLWLIQFGRFISTFI